VTPICPKPPPLLTFCITFHISIARLQIWHSGTAACRAELSGANCHAKLSHSKRLLKNIHPMTLTQKPKKSPSVRNCSYKEERRRDQTLAHTINVQTVTDGISRRVTSGQENNSLILVDHRVKAIEGCYRNVMLL